MGTGSISGLGTKIPHAPWCGKNIYIHIYKQCFCGSSMVKNPPADAGDSSLSRIRESSHVPWNNGTCAPQPLCSRTQKPQRLKPEKPELCSSRGAATMRSPSPGTREQPLLTSREMPSQQRRPSTAPKKAHTEDLPFGARQLFVAARPVH